MRRLTVHGAAPADGPAAEGKKSPSPPAPLAPLLVGIGELSRLLSRSVASLERDAAAGRLPAALRIGGSKRWNYSEIVAWVEAGCPGRLAWEALRHAQHGGRRG
jgi:hypothetical protein